MKGQTGQVVPCTGTCGLNTRNAKMNKNDYPGTRVRTKGGMCSSCRRVLDPEWAEQARARERDRKLSQRPAGPAKLTETSSALTSYLAARARRLANQPQRRSLGRPAHPYQREGISA